MELATMIDVNLELSSTNHQFMHALNAEGWLPHEVEEVARQFHISEEEINMWAKRDPSAESTAGHLEVETRIAIIAQKMSACLTNRGAPSTPAILNLNNDQLLDAIDYYYGNLELLYAGMVEIEQVTFDRWGNPKWCELRKDFDRQAGFLWEAEHRAGITRLNEAVLAGGV